MACLFVRQDTKCIIMVTARTETGSSGDVLSKPARRTLILNVITLIFAHHLLMVELSILIQQIIHVYILLLPEEQTSGRTYMTIGHQQREYSSERRTILTSALLRLAPKSVFFSMLFWQLLLFTLEHGIVRTIRIHLSIKPLFLTLSLYFASVISLFTCHALILPFIIEITKYFSLNPWILFFMLFFCLSVTYFLR